MTRSNIDDDQHGDEIDADGAERRTGDSVEGADIGTDEFTDHDAQQRADAGTGGYEHDDSRASICRDSSAAQSAGHVWRDRHREGAATR